MVLENSYYFTSELEIKPQLKLLIQLFLTNYFTSELEIKPQLSSYLWIAGLHYFISELEIKPQLFSSILTAYSIILHQNQKSNHKYTQNQEKFSNYFKI